MPCFQGRGLARGFCLRPAAPAWWRRGREPSATKELFQHQTGVHALKRRVCVTLQLRKVTDGLHVAKNHADCTWLPEALSVSWQWPGNGERKKGTSRKLMFHPSCVGILQDQTR